MLINYKSWHNLIKVLFTCTNQYVLLRVQKRSILSFWN